MARQVTMPEQQQSMEKKVVPMVTGLVGAAAGSYYGGPAGGAAGGAVGGEIGQAAVGSDQQIQAAQGTPVDRRMQQQEQIASLRQGLDVARNSDNPENRQYLPYLEEAMKKAKGGYA